MSSELCVDLAGPRRLVRRLEPFPWCCNSRRMRCRRLAAHPNYKPLTTLPLLDVPTIEGIIAGGDVATRAAVGMGFQQRTPARQMIRRGAVTASSARVLLGFYETSSAKVLGLSAGWGRHAVT